MEENTLVLNTIELLDEEKESILSQLLKCSVCFELPDGKQVQICEQGHHFCFTCHKKMNACGICRGRLLETRNFVVEQLVTKLGAILGTSKYEQPPAELPPNLSPGEYKCPHCQCGIPAFQMLPHLRAKHSTNLKDNLRSNPYSRRFSFKYNLHFGENNKYILSAQVSDMGLFTVQSDFSGLDFFGCVRVLGDGNISSLFRHQLVVKIPNGSSDSFLEFSLTECSVSSYLEDVESIRTQGKGLRIKGETLLEYIQPGSTISLFFSVWKNPVTSESKRLPASVICLPERDLVFENDRKIRRNRNRNIRRRRLRERFKASLEELPRGIATIAL